MQPAAAAGLQGHASDPLDVVVLRVVRPVKKYRKALSDSRELNPIWAALRAASQDVELAEAGGAKLFVRPEDAERVLRHFRTAGFVDGDEGHKLLHNMQSRHMIVAAEYEELVMRVLDRLPRTERISPTRSAAIRILPSHHEGMLHEEAVESDPVEDASSSDMLVEVETPEEEDVPLTQLDPSSDVEEDAFAEQANSPDDAAAAFATRQAYKWIEVRTFVNIPMVTASEGQFTVSSGGLDVRRPKRRLDDSQSSSTRQRIDGEESQASSACFSTPPR